MKTTLNVFPNNRWSVITSKHYDENKGNCVILGFTDNCGDNSEIAIFYKEDYDSFLKKLLSAIHQLPKTITCCFCGQELKPKEEGK